MASVINYFAQLPVQDGYTTIKRTVAIGAGGTGTFDYGVVPAGTQLVAVYASDVNGGAAAPSPADTTPFINGTTMGFGRSDVAAPAPMYDWAPYTFSASQQGILTINLDGLAATWGGLTVDLYLYVFIPQIPCP